MLCNWCIYTLASWETKQSISPWLSCVPEVSLGWGLCWDHIPHRLLLTPPTVALANCLLRQFSLLAHAFHNRAITRTRQHLKSCTLCIQTKLNKYSHLYPRFRIAIYYLLVVIVLNLFLKVGYELLRAFGNSWHRCHNKQTNKLKTDIARDLGKLLPCATVPMHS